MPEINCPTCGQCIDVFFHERERRLEAQRRTAKRLSEQSTEAASLVKQGWSTRRIARHFGVTIERAWRLARPGGWFSNRCVDYAKVRRLYESGMRADEIAKKLGCHVTTVYRGLKG